MSTDTTPAPPTVPPGYKQTEIGVIPQEWETKRLGDVAEIMSGATPSTNIPDYWNGTIPWCTPTDITSTSGKYLVGTERTLTVEGLKNCAAALLPVGTLLLCSRATIGEVKIASLPVCTNQGFKSLICADNVYNEFLYYLVLLLKPQMIERATGSTFLEISKHDVAMILIPLPPLAEQRAIAAALADVDRLIAALDAQIAKHRAIKQATMQQLLTGRMRLPGFGGEWETKRLGEVEADGNIRLFRGNVISQKDIEHTPGNYPIYSSSVQSNGLFGHYGKYMLDEELITWSVDGGGHFFYRSKHRFSVTNVCGYIRVLSKKISCRYLAYQLQVLHSRKVFDYTLKAHPSVIRNEYTIILPSIEEQRAIASVLADMDAEIAALERQRDKTNDIKQGMMQELLTGRIRLTPTEV